MKKTKKILFIVLSMFLVSLISGCNPEDFNKLNDYAVNMNIDLNEKIELTGIYPNSGMSDSDFKNSYTSRYYEQLTGYKVNYEQILSSDTSGIITNILTTSQPYHFMKLESGTYFSLVSKNSFVDLKPALEKFGNNILEVIPQDAWDAVTVDGKIYAIPEVGFAPMIGSTLVWNMSQLAEVGITKVPETIGEIDEAFHALQTHFGSKNTSYRAFGMSGAEAYMSQLACAYDIPKDFFENENGEIQSVIYHPNYENYITWLNSLVVDNILSREWQGYSGATLVNNFAKGNLGCGYINYWSINNLVESLSASNRISEEEARKMLGWVTAVRGDGTHGSVSQTEAKYLGGRGIGYYIAVPIHMAENAGYVLDWINKRITREAYEGYYIGEEGTHYTISDASNPNAIKINLADGEKYILTTELFDREVLGNSMYATGVNGDVGKELWKVREATYNAWEIIIPDEKIMLENAINMAPYIKGWSEIDIASRSWILTIEQQIINAKNLNQAKLTLSQLKEAWPVRYWTEEVNANVQAWYKNKD